MKYSYYPGCSAHGTGIEVGGSTLDLCKALGVELNEVDDWSCCGASSAHATNEDLSVTLAARNLRQADDTGFDIVTPCPACFGRLSAAKKHIAEHGAPEGMDVKAQMDVRHIVHLFEQDELIEKLREQAKKTLAGLKVVCYYGCLITRPPEITGAAHPENPNEMDKILSALGAEVIDWPYKTQCCGGMLTMTRDEIVASMSNDIFEMAKAAQADAVVTGCQMCFMNLDRQFTDAKAKASGNLLPVFYFTELMLLTLNPSAARSYMKRHLSNPEPLLRARGLL